MVNFKKKRHIDSVEAYATCVCAMSSCSCGCYCGNCGCGNVASRALDSNSFSSEDSSGNRTNDVQSGYSSSTMQL